MSSPTLAEAERIMTICNACRYCEGFCAVFPAMELRRAFTPADLHYFANLCHDCRDCFHACQYAPPHEFSINVPRALSELRLLGYMKCARPRFLSSLFGNNPRFAALLTCSCLVVVTVASLFNGGVLALTTVHAGGGAFYRILPYPALVYSFSLAAWAVAVSLGASARAFRKEIATDGQPHYNRRALLAALRDTLLLKYLSGGGAGCNYPDDRFSMIRRYLHHAVFYGFLSCFAATAVAACYDHLLHRAAPYPLISWPVALGTLGGTAVLVGASGLLWLKTKLDHAPQASKLLGMDVVFLILVMLTSLTGLLLLIFRATRFMGLLLDLHLALVASLFLSIPCGKFVHGAYRFIALAQHAAEEAEERS